MGAHQANTVVPSAPGSAEASLLIAEFNALRDEILDNFNTARTIAALYLTGLSAVVTAVISERLDPNAILGIAYISALFWWVHLDTRMIVGMIGAYLDVLSKRARELGSTRIFRWEEEIRARRGHPGFWPWRWGLALDGTAAPIYFIPGLASLVYTLARPSLDQGRIPFWPWIGWGFIVLVLVGLRAILTERAWWEGPERAKPACKTSDQE